MGSARSPSPPPGDGARVVELGGLDRALDEVALAGHRFDQVHLRLSERGREHESREARAGADVGQPPRRADQLDATERVDHVDPPRLLGIANRAERRRVARKQVEDGLKARAELGVAQSPTSGATIT